MKKQKWTIKKGRDMFTIQRDNQWKPNRWEKYLLWVRKPSSQLFKECVFFERKKREKWKLLCFIFFKSWMSVYDSCNCSFSHHQANRRCFSTLFSSFPFSHPLPMPLSKTSVWQTLYERWICDHIRQETLLNHLLLHLKRFPQLTLPTKPSYSSAISTWCSSMWSL